MNTRKNHPLHRPIAALALCLAAAVAAFAAPQAAPPESTGRSTRTLKDVAAKYFLIGMAGDIPNGYSDAEIQIIKDNFTVVTPENCMKPAPVHPEENTWRFERPDALVKWCEENHVAVHGHTLVWHAQTNNWFFTGGDKEKITQRLKDHITTLVGHYKGRIRSWDVVNEAINDGGNADTGKTENLRNSQWLRNLGPEFLTLAFKFAHEADPDCKLFYNDYNIETGPKHASSMVLLKRLIKDGAPIYGVGIQGHWNSATVPLEAVDKAISDYESLGLKVSISELDLTIRGASGGQFGPGPARGRGRGAASQPGSRPATPRGPATPASAQDLKTQADSYAKVFTIFARHKGVIDRVTLWGLSDRRSWRAAQNPLLFDNNNNPKPAYFSVIEALDAASAR